MRWVVLVVLCAACGSSPPPAPAGKANQVALVSPGEPGDVVVAQVNGRPVWGSCVARQATKGIDRQAALRECIDFELLAQEAEKRGLASGPEIDEAFKTAMVDRFVATQYEARYAKPSDFGAMMEKAVTDNDIRRHRPDLRGSSYARVTIDPPGPARQMPPGDMREGAAQAIAEKLAARLAPEEGLLPANLEDIAEDFHDELARSHLRIDRETLPPTAAIALDKPYADTLYAIPAIGRTGGPVRTKWGWDVILWTDFLPAQEMTREQLAAELFPKMRREFFLLWAFQFEKTGVAVQRFEDNYPKMVQEGS